ncbi:MAG: tRNA (adenosine(37)-N6)-dimethylallyltransferase MiaA [SAR202 cluster bacterium]|nr:tRNA (adenosine(37)-N6)-dimethylallyltransferase MiaA [SAR202 cluster bacterium]
MVGATATGKTALAIQLAQELDGEIIGADSRQVYRHMDIGTAKPSAEQRADVPHHLLDIVDPDEPYSLALFLRQARAAIYDIHSRGHLPILVGGTGQYVWGLLEGWQVPEVPPAPELRAELEARAASEGGGALYAELRAADPQSADRIDPHNIRRVIRALEVYAVSGETSSSNPRRIAPDWNTILVGLRLDRADLYSRVDRRVDQMLETGWVDEVKTLLERGYAPELSSMSGLGYRELCQHIQDGTTLEDATDAAKRRIRRFARQQHAWFRETDERIAWHNADEAGLEEASSVVRDWVLGPGG